MLASELYLHIVDVFVPKKIKSAPLVCIWHCYDYVLIWFQITSPNQFQIKLGWIVYCLTTWQ